MTSGYVGRRRLAQIPDACRLSHEYCYFLHDQCVRLFIEYEARNATTVKVKFRNRKEHAAFTSPGVHPLDALISMGRKDEARRVALNQVTMAMVSDALLHVFEALACMEKRKTVVALNLLRKPLTDSLIFLCWMLGDEDGFYSTFAGGDVENLSTNKLGNRRKAIIAAAVASLAREHQIDGEWIWSSLFDSKNPEGLYGLFQKAVHLVTIQKAELRTEAENFNFIFKNPSDDDIYHSVYWYLPPLLDFLAHVIMSLFERIRVMDKGARTAFDIRSRLGLKLVEGGPPEQDVCEILQSTLGKTFICPNCRAPLHVTPHNAARLTLSESYRCPACRRVQPFPFSWLF